MVSTDQEFSLGQRYEDRIPIPAYHSTSLASLTFTCASGREQRLDLFDRSCCSNCAYLTMDERAISANQRPGWRRPDAIFAPRIAAIVVAHGIDNVPCVNDVADVVARTIGVNGDDLQPLFPVGLGPCVQGRSLRPAGASGVAKEDEEHRASSKCFK